MEIRELSLEALSLALKGGSLPVAAGPLFFIVDIGATNCRFGLFPANSKTLTIIFTKMTANSVPQLIKQLALFQDTIGSSYCQRIVASALNLPGPVSRGAVGGPIANYLGATPNAKTVFLRDLPAPLFPKGRSVMLNDLEACAHGVAAVSDFGLFPTIFRVMWPAGPGANALRDSDPAALPKGIPAGHCLVVAPGTGLGAALVEENSSTGALTVLPLEFGHTSVQSVSDDAFLQKHRAELGRSVEYDDVCSGRGLERLYVSEGAKRGDAPCVAAMAAYNRLLMRFCSELTMGFVAGSVVLCGDNVVKNGFAYSDGNASVQGMRAAYMEHAMERMGFMSRVTVMRQAETVNLNLVGCVHACKHLPSADARAKL
jgi:glucokinase